MEACSDSGSRDAQENHVVAMRKRRVVKNLMDGVVWRGGNERKQARKSKRTSLK